MGQSTNANICFGIPFPEYFTFPWMEKEPIDFENEFDKWWANENGVPPPAEPFNDLTREIYHSYWDKCRALESQCPVEVFNHCSGEFPMYILGLRGTEVTACRGDTKNVEISEKDGQPILEFCKKHNIQTEESPRWLLYSYWN